MNGIDKTCIQRKTHRQQTLRNGVAKRCLLCCNQSVPAAVGRAIPHVFSGIKWGAVSNQACMKFKSYHS